MATKTYLQTKRYTKEDNDYFWIKNVDFKDTNLGFYVGSMTSNPEYSYDKVTWYDKTEGGDWWNIHLKPGQKVYLRNDAGFWNTGNYIMSPFQFDILRLAVGGPISSLIDYTDMSNVTSIPNYCFYDLLSGRNIQNDITSGDRWYDASQIDFGNITSVGEYGMQSMFSSCKNLKYAPDLSGITTVSNNYGMNSLFQQCYNLCEVTAPNVSVWDTTAMQNWLSETGDYLSEEKIVNCPTGVVIPTDDPNGIPSGWTRVDY